MATRLGTRHRRRPPTIHRGRGQRFKAPGLELARRGAADLLPAAFDQVLREGPQNAEFLLGSHFNEPPESLCRGNEIESGHSPIRVISWRAFLKIFENPGSHRYEDKGVSAARFPALRDSSEDHVVPMTEAGHWRTALSNNRFTAKMILIDHLVHPDPRHFNSGTEPHATA